MSISVKVCYNSSLHRLHIPRNSDFRSLCSALIKALRLSLSPKVLADPARTPLTIWFLDDEREYCRLFDDLSLREALRISPRLLCLRIGPASVPPENIDIHSLPVIGPAADALDTYSSVPPQFTSSTLLKLLSFLKKNSPSQVQDALSTLYDNLHRRKSDRQYIHDLRRDLASLFSNFLAKNLSPSTRGKILPEDSEALQAVLRELLRDASVSRATREAAVRAVRATCDCRTSCDLLRVRYSELLSDLAKRKGEILIVKKGNKLGKDNSEEGKHVIRPVRYYLNQFVKLMRVAGPDAQDAYETFAVVKREAEARRPKLIIPRRLCKSIHRASFHFLKNHVKEGRNFEIEVRAVKCLGKTIKKKLQRQGYDQNVAEAARDLGELMAMDRQVLNLAYEWANNPDKPVTEPVDDDEDFPEFREEDQEWGDWQNVMSDSSKRRRKKGSQQRKQKKSTSRREYWSEESSSSSGESHHDRRGRRRSFRGRLRRRKGKYADDSSYSSTSSSSLQTVQEAEWGDDRRWSRRGEKYGAMMSPMHSSEDPWRAEGTKNYHSDAQESTGTHESQWARVQMEKEKVMEAKRARQRRLALRRYVERGRMVEAQLARNRALDMEEIRRPDSWQRGSRRRSFGHSREDFSSHQLHSGSRRGSYHINSPHHGPPGWGQDYGAHWGAEEVRGEQIPNRSSRRNSFRSVGERVRDSFHSGGGFANRSQQRRGSPPPAVPVWNGDINQPGAAVQDWGLQ